jgi:hypothetical protein
MNWLDEPETTPGLHQQFFARGSLNGFFGCLPALALYAKERHCPGRAANFSRSNLKFFLDSGILFRFKDS